jgi:hypothetical protein
VKRGGAFVLIVWAASVIGACNLVLGIDDVSPANAPDGGRGQQIFPSTAERRDGGSDSVDAAAETERPSGDASGTSTTPDRLDAGRPHDASVRGVSDSSTEDAGPADEDAGLPR